MPTVITHAVSAAALTTAFPNRSVPRRLIILGGICAMAPDLDVFGFGSASVTKTYGATAVSRIL